MRLSKCFTLILSALIASTAVQAQFFSGAGFKAGVALSNLRQTDVTPQYYQGMLLASYYPEGNVVSPTISIFADFLNEQYIGLETELTYVRKGGSTTYEVMFTSASQPEGTGQVEVFRYETVLQYLVLALDAKPNLPLGDVSLYGQLGPTAGYLLSSSNFGSVDNFNNFRWGYILGLGLDFNRLLGVHMFLEAHYASDFRPVYDQPNAKLWNRTWTMSFGTTF